jgi:hypothetical protein
VPALQASTGEIFMTPFVVAAFRSRSAAERAIERLRDSGVATRGVRLHATTSDVTNAASLEADELVTGGFVGNAAKILDELFGTRPDPGRAETYDEMVRREATLVSVQVETSEAAAQLADWFSAEGAERVSTLPQRGLES